MGLRIIVFSGSALKVDNSANFFRPLAARTNPWHPAQYHCLVNVLLISSICQQAWGIGNLGYFFHDALFSSQVQEVVYLYVYGAWCTWKKCCSVGFIRGGSGFLLNKTQSPSTRVGLGPKPNFFIYVVKPEPELSPTYLVNFSSPKKPKPEVLSPSPTQAQKIRPNPPLAIYL
jgi:hypothetical protein